MQIQRLPLSQLQPAPYNPRITLKPGTPAYEKIARSIREFELVQPLVWNQRTGYVVGGHQRLQILKETGVAEVECVVVDLPLEREKALNIALNNQEVAGNWDADKLLEVLTDLQEIPDFDPTLTGFDERQLNDLMFQPANKDAVEVEITPTDRMTVSLDIPTARWAAVSLLLDEMLAAEPQVRLHLNNGAKSM